MDNKPIPTDFLRYPLIVAGAAQAAYWLIVQETAIQVRWEKIEAGGWQFTFSVSKGKAQKK